MSKKKAMSNEKKRYVAEFFTLEHISLVCPEGRHEKRRYCREPLPILFREYGHFMEEKGEQLGHDVDTFCETYMVAYSTFCKYRPSHVKPSSRVPPRMCVCEYCENIRFCQQALEEARVKGIPRSIHEILRKTWCPYDYPTKKFPQYMCAKRKCSTCGEKKGTNKFQSDIKQLRDNRNVQWEMSLSYQMWGRRNAGDKLELLDKTASVADVLYGAA
jgi:hypothetical protein